jgi:hypothetical protein
MFNKFKQNLSKALGIKVDFRTDFGVLQTQINQLHKKFPPGPTTRFEITSNRHRNEKELKELNKQYDEELINLNNKYKNLEQDAVLEGMRREISIREKSNAAQFNIPLTNEVCQKQTEK